MYRAIAITMVMAVAACEGAIGATVDVGGGPKDPDAAPAAVDGRAPDPSDAAPVAPDADNGRRLLTNEPGCFFEVASPTDDLRIVVGEPGVAYRTLVIQYDVFHGGWRTELFDRPVLNHGLLNLSRVVPDFVGRYILGNAAQIRPPAGGLDPKSLMYGRVDLDPRPDGEGYTGYTSWRTPAAWQPGHTYHVLIRLDAAGGRQILELSENGSRLARTVGDIPYFDPSLTTSTFALELGGTESDGREVKAVGWRFCDLTVVGVEARD